MHYVLHIQVCCVVLLGASENALAANQPHDEDLFMKHVKNVETVLSPALVEELRGGGKSNRTSVNVSMTAPRTNEESSPGINGKKQDIKVESQMNPYHYERSYHYSYPNNDAPGTTQITDDFYRPYFRPKYPYDSGNYRLSDPYNLYSTSTAGRGANADEISKPNEFSNAVVNQDENSKVDNERRRLPNPSSPLPLPPHNAFASPDINYIPQQQQNQFSSNDFERFRHSVLNNKPLSGVDSRYSGLEAPGTPAPSMNTNQQQIYHSLVNNDKYPAGPSPPAGSYQNFAPPRHSPSDSFPNLPPSQNLHPELFQNFPPRKPFTESYQNIGTPKNSFQQNGLYLPPSFQGPFQRQGYQIPHNTFWPRSEQFNNLFSNNFTNNFPPSFPLHEPFYPHLNNNKYFNDSPASAGTHNQEPKMEQSSESNESKKQPSNVKADEAGKSTAAAAAEPSSKYEVKLFLPENDDFENVFRPRTMSQFTFSTRNFRF